MAKWEPQSLFYGGDYNPEQWSREVWDEDVELMKRAKVNLVTLGVFAWANIEIADNKYEFGWLDEIIQLLHSNGIGVDLATGTASPPAWLTRQHPEILPLSYDGVRMAHGGRQGYCVSSPIYKSKAAELAGQLGRRYGTHPAIKMWHINNEYGCHNALCFCEISGKAWRDWLISKYETLGNLNFAWGTNFWSQRYHDWDEIRPPSRTPDGTFPNPTMLLDYRRFSNAQILDLFLSEREAIRLHDKFNPITTNFMSMKHSSNLDYWQWAKEVDFVSTDHYLIAEDQENYIDLAFQADLTRGFAGGKPWLLMEHSTSAVNWQNRNIAKTDGEMFANSLSHVARGSNGAMFFQWRQSVSGSEKFHSAMVPHSGTKSRIWNHVVELGDKLEQLTKVVNVPTNKAQVAMIFDYESWWALSQRNLPSTSISYPDLAHEWYKALWKLGVQVDFLSPHSSATQLAEYPLVLAPMLYLLSDQQEEQLLNYSASGGSLVCSYFSGVSNQHDHVKVGGYGGQLVKKLYRLLVEEFAPAREDELIELSDGLTSFDWSQFSTTESSNVISRFNSGMAKGNPAIVSSLSGNHWYLGTRLTEDSNLKFFDSVIDTLNLSQTGGSGIEILQRGSLTFEINQNTKAVRWYENETK